jgi:methionine-rich copper-binding protein CopC
MKSLQDALYNWLTIKVVADARPNDQAAKETELFFAEILKKDFHVTNISVTKNEVMYAIKYEKDNEEKTARFPVELIEVMLEQINSEPEKYVNYPI